STPTATESQPLWRRIIGLPSTRFGWWSISLALAFLVLFPIFRHFCNTPPPCRAFCRQIPLLDRATADLSSGHRQQRHPDAASPRTAAVQMTFRQQKPVVASMFHQPPSGLHQPLLQTRQRPVLDPSGQSQPPRQEKDVS